ncbi:MAG: Spy/CpxP family protein refolding chaperone [Acidobacteriota bacterium]|nr:Spy/CpxP family protein refolding chaperone [Acidobacteriota bacterium]MDQ7088328.1 Spy/CpxP family protein refolding chaperone [Acidobacteriota bacterium]
MRFPRYVSHAPLLPILAALAVALPAGAAPAPAGAGGPHGGPPPADCPHDPGTPPFGPAALGFGPGPLGPGVFARLGLSADQRARIRAVRQSRIAENADLLEQLTAHRQAMQELWKAERPDKEKILARWKEGAQLRRQWYEKMVDMRLAVLEVLTPEQRGKLRELADTPPNRRHGPTHGHGHHGKRRGHPGCGGGPPA